MQLNIFKIFRVLTIFTVINCEKIGLTFEVGRMHFSDKEWQMSYTVNMTQYHETSIVMENCTDQISRICDIMENNYCQHFFSRSMQFQETINFDKRRLVAHKRSKRLFFLIFVPFIVGVSSMALLSSLATDKKALQIVKQELGANLNMLEKTIHTTKNLIEIHEKMIQDLENGVINLSNLINKLNDKIDRNQHLNNILFTVAFAMIDHNKNQNKLLNLFNGDAEKNVFNIIDYGQFLSELRKVNKRLSPSNFMVAPITVDRVKLLTTSVTQELDTISILLRVPVVQKTENIIYEFTPIPFKYDNQLYILDSDPTSYFVSGNGTKVLYLGANMQCDTSRNFTLCRNIFEDELNEISGCLQSTDSNGFSEFCKYKPIVEKNYRIEIPRRGLYFHIVTPIIMKLICNGLEKILQINESQLIEYNNDCRVYNSANNVGGFVMKSKSSINITIASPQIYEFNTSTKQWSDHVEILSKYDLQLIETSKGYNKLQADILLHREIVENIELNTFLDDILEFFNLENFLPLKQIKIGLYLIGIFIALYFIISCISPLLRKNTS